MFHSPQLEQVPFSPPPWHLSGQAWGGIFRTDVAPPLPEQYRYVLNPRHVIVAMIRYSSGTLRYDELIVGSLAWHQWRAGLYVHHIWVDDLASLWGGRKIWGLPKEMAVFAWEDDTVTISDAGGLILQMKVNLERALLPPLPFWTPAFGKLNERSLFTVGRIKARLGRAGITIKGWSERFGFQVGAKPVLSVAGKPFSLIFSSPTIL